MADSSSTPWAKEATDNDPAAALKTFENGLGVHLIATPRVAFTTCTADEILVAVVERNRADHFDYLPVTEPKHSSASRSDRIVGLIEIASFLGETAVPLGSVRPHVRPLSEEILIGADAGILAFVRDADRQPFRFVVSGPEISGLVSLSDLQRLPVRAALFAMVTHLEIVMTYFIRSEFGATDRWLPRLSEERQTGVCRRVAESKKGDAFVESLLLTQFADKVTIIRKSPHFAFAKNEFKNDLKRVQSLRDALAHANNYAATRNDARAVCETTRLIDKWIERLASGFSSPGLARDRTDVVPE